jgi:hypothetical protein
VLRESASSIALARYFVYARAFQLPTEGVSILERVEPTLCESTVDKLASDRTSQLEKLSVTAITHE